MGSNWERKITVPKEPMLSYKRGKERRGRKNSMDRSISKELIARNISLEQIQTKEYATDEDDRESFHNHFYQDSDSDLVIARKMDVERYRRKNLIAEKMLENTMNRTSTAGSQRSLNKSNINRQVDFSKSSSNVENMKVRSLMTSSPQQKIEESKSPEPMYTFSKPPRAPTSLASIKPKPKDSNKMIRIQEEEYFEDNQQPDQNTSDEFHYSADLEILNHGKYQYAVILKIFMLS